MTEYKFWVVYKEGQFYGRFPTYDLATEEAMKLAQLSEEYKPVYVLEAVWYCKAKTAFDMQEITERRQPEPD